MADMATSLLAYLPTIPTPPHHGTFASLSGVTLLSLLYTNRVPGHPLVVVAWAGVSYLVNGWWLKLKIKQVTATVLKEVDGLLEKQGACAECRGLVLTGGPRDLAMLLVDLRRVNEKERARRERRMEEEDGRGGGEDRVEKKRLAEEDKGLVEEEKRLAERVALTDPLAVVLASLNNPAAPERDVISQNAVDGNENGTKSDKEERLVENGTEDDQD
ncbi:hypothetical protein PMIN02_001644 [Paraphaeosphaeria minitans]